MKKPNKKLIILYILRMLKKGSSKEVPITQATISKTLKLLNFDCERKTVAKYIDALIEFGYTIIKISGGGCYLKQ